MQVYVRLVEGGKLLKVGDHTLAMGQAVQLTVDGSLTLEESDEAPPIAGTDESKDVFSPGNRPNGEVLIAAIAPKMPKSGGETRQEPLPGGGVVEREVAPLGVATQGGGPDSPDTITTPGPKPEPMRAQVDQGKGAATGTPPDGPSAGLGGEDAPVKEEEPPARESAPAKKEGSKPGPSLRK